MADSFVLRYPAPGASPDAAEWVVVDARGARVGAIGRGTLAEAAQAQGAQRLLVLVPGTEVTLAAPELPARGGGKLAKLVPYALEEQLATEIEAMHFALGRQGLDRRVPVAAVERARLAGWLAALEAAGLAPAAVYPDSLTVPDNPAHVVVVLEGDGVVVRRPATLPLSLEADPLDAALALAGLPTAPQDGPDAAAHVLVYVDAVDWPRHQAVIEALRDRVATLKVQVLAEGVLPLLAAGAVAGPALSLLQGELLPRQGLAGQWSRWRLAASLAAAFLALHVATLGVDWWRLSRDEAKVDAELRSAAAEALPNVQNLARLPNLRLAVESRVRSTRAAINEGLLGTLGVLSASVGAAPGTRLQSLSYRGGTTDLTLDAPDVAALDRVQQAAKGRGYDAQLQGATQRDQRYEGHLQLEGAGHVSAPLRERLEGWYAGLNPREQQVVRIGTIAGGALLVAGLVIRMHGAVQAAEKRLLGKRADVAYVQSVLPELRAAPLPAGGGQSLVAVVDRTTRDAGLAMNLKGTEPSGVSGVRVRFEGASFAQLVTWMLRIQQEYGLSIQAATLEKTDNPGHVNANLTFVRS